jgi:L-ascorbate metabolism protein UlaG (beta-lactamase superfamily)
MSIAHQITLPSGDAPSDAGTGSVFFIGNATVLIRCAGFTVLTDPNFIHRHGQVDLGNGLHATRLTDPAMEISELPPLDLVVLSHFHGDHFDQVAEQNLDRSLPIVTAPEAAEKLRDRAFTNVHALERWDSITVTKGANTLRITATPGRHGPPVVSWALPDVMGSVLEFGTGGDARYRMYITGDTLVIDDLREIPVRYPAIDLALLHLGGTRALGIMVTMDAEQGTELLGIVQPQLAIPIHYNDYDVFKSPLSDFHHAVEAAGLQERVRYLAHAESFVFELRAEHMAGSPRMVTRKPS